MIRLINITLALLSILGGVLAFRESNFNSDLSAEYRTLAAETGYLDFADFSKVHVVALPSDDPLHFRWRIYLPEKCTVSWKAKSQWDDVSGSSSGPQNFIAQVRFRKNENGFVRVFTDLESFGGVGALGGRELQEFMRDHWDDVDIYQLGLDGPALVDPEEIATLLRLQLPQDIADEAKEVLRTRSAGQVLPVLYQVQLGTKEVWQKTELEKSAGGAVNQ
jgi:hypothetical protein